jgi:hypothetical protein
MNRMVRSRDHLDNTRASPIVLSTERSWICFCLVYQ